ncbi:hypothetical protein AVEN_142265-1 [Araneus ventricosus]|uniref:Uncharacterized protein n=1 Tax=Araneus ventricosus TaxID=182803 RepID=A0A4Y2QXL7_ARAVE|nr:hypothetical protein AVEN_142265-1 [Araneus ventricosus]
MRRGFEFVLILQTTRGSNFGLPATEVYLTSFIILVFSTCVRSIRESLGETTPAGCSLMFPAADAVGPFFSPAVVDGLPFLMVVHLVVPFECQTSEGYVEEHNDAERNRDCLFFPLSLSCCFAEMFAWGF